MTAALSPSAAAMLVGLPPARRRIVEAGLLSGVVDPLAGGRIAEAQRERRRVLDEAAAAAARDAAIASAARLAKASVFRPLWRVIVDEVATAAGLTADDILGPSHKRVFVTPRQAVMYRLMAETTMTLPEIGRRIQRDHTTVLYGARRHAERNGLPMLEGMRGNVEVASVDGAGRAAE